MEDKQPPIPQDRAKLYRYAKGETFAGKKITDVFSSIYQNRTWDEQSTRESVSGSGSSFAQTKHIVQALPALLDQYLIRSVLDIPCGDFHWMQQLDWTGRTYTGADIVKALIEQNQSKFSNNNIQFRQLDLTRDELPAHDLIFCRDCLVHFSYQDIRKAIRHIRQSQSCYLLTTTFTEQTINEDVTTGGWRPLNFEREPFSFPKPLTLIHEKCTEMNGIFRDKSLGLWKITDL